MSVLAHLPDFLTVEETAAEVRIGRTAAYDAVRRGEIPSIRIGRTIRVPRHALERMLMLDGAPEYKTTPAGEPGPSQLAVAGGEHDSG